MHWLTFENVTRQARNLSDDVLTGERTNNTIEPNHAGTQRHPRGCHNVVLILSFALSAHKRRFQLDKLSSSLLSTCTVCFLGAPTSSTSLIILLESSQTESQKLVPLDGDVVQRL